MSRVNRQMKSYFTCPVRAFIRTWHVSVDLTYDWMCLGHPVAYWLLTAPKDE
jgi:hypothetical protein